MGFALAQVLDAKVVLTRPKGPKGNSLKVAECLVGDESGIIVFTARNEQGEPRPSIAQPTPRVRPPGRPSDARSRSRS